MRDIPSYKAVEGGFSAMRIWAGEELRGKNRYALFRREVILSGGGECTVRISADTYYNLYIDGSFINRGPVRHHEMAYEYDELTVSLCEGRHIIAVLVHHIGVECATHRIGERMLWLEMETPDGLIITDESWRAIEACAYLDSEEPMSHFGFREICDMRLYPEGWTLPDFADDEWPFARVLGGVDDDCHTGYSRRGLKLFNYIPLVGEIISQGSFTEGEGEAESFWERVSLRRRIADGAVGDGGYTIADFGVSLSGTVEIHYEGAEDGCELIVSYDDMLNPEGYIDNCRAIGFSDKFILKGGSGCVSTAMVRGFRYIMADAQGGCRVTSIGVLKEEYPYSERSPFISDDSLLTNLYRQSARTQRICTIDGFTDCVTRERVLWLGDAYMDCLGNYYSEPDRGLVLDTIYQHAHSQRESGSLCGYTMSDLTPDWICMTSYNMMWLHMLCDYALYTGDTDSLLPLMPTAERLIQYLLTLRNEDGIIDTARGGDGFWEWGFSEDEGLLLMSNAYFIHTVERLYAHPHFTHLIGEELHAEMSEMREQCFELFYDRDEGIFVDAIRPDGGRSLRSQTANCFAIMSGICPEEMRGAVIEKIFDPARLGEMAVGEWSNGDKATEPDRTRINPVSSMYSAMFVCKSLFDVGYHGEAIELMREVWGPFSELPTLPELCKNGRNNTMCHGWSGAPAFLLPMYVVGLRPTADGWDEAEFAPPTGNVGGLTNAKCSVMTPHGELKAQWTSTAGTLKLYAEAPRGVSLTIRAEGRSYTCSGGSITRYILTGQ